MRNIVTSLCYPLLFTVLMIEITSASSNLTHANMALPNCQTLDEGKLNVNYLIDMDNDLVIIEVNSVIEYDDEYVAFGLSGSEVVTQMIGSDVDVMSMDGHGNATIVDYSLLSQEKCKWNGNNGTGACPDTKASSTAHDDVALLTHSNRNGTKTFRYQRPLRAQDSAYDREIPTNRPINVVWARGQKADDGLINKHATHIRATDNIRINFGQNGTQPCAPLIPTATAVMTSKMTANEDDTIITGSSVAPQAGDHGNTISISALLMWIVLVVHGVLF